MSSDKLTKRELWERDARKSRVYTRREFFDWLRQFDLQKTTTVELAIHVGSELEGQLGLWHITAEEKSEIGAASDSASNLEAPYIVHLQGDPRRAYFINRIEAEGCSPDEYTIRLIPQSMTFFRQDRSGIKRLKWLSKRVAK